MLMRLASQSLKSRKTSVLLTIFSLCISLVVLLAVQQISTQAKQSFSRTVSGVDLIVGARTGSLNLLLSSVYRMGAGGNAISWQSYEALSQHPMVSWSIPIVLGDSHKGYAVVGTTEDYFTHFKYGNKQVIEFSSGRGFDVIDDNAESVVLGAEVAQKLGYRLGDTLHLSHGTGKVSFSHHDNVSFIVTGILMPTGTPIDQSLHVTVHAIELMHSEPELINSHTSTNKDVYHEHGHEEHDDHAGHNHSVEPDKLNAVFLGLKAKYATLVVQKYVNDFKSEPLMAIIPGVTLTELWRLMKGVEGVLVVISILVLIATLLGMATMMLSSMRERKQEFAIYRAVGASPWQIVWLIQLEIMLTMFVSVVIANLALFGLTSAFANILSSRFGVFIEAELFNPTLLSISFAAFVLACIVGLLPALSAYRMSKQQAS